MTDLRVDAPRLVRLERVDPDRLSVGDQATMEFGPGFLSLMEHRGADGRLLGEGLSAEWETPVGAAGHACYAVFQPVGGPPPNFWTGVQNTVVWTRAARLDESLLATSKLVRLGHTSSTLEYVVRSLERGDTLITGELVFVSVREGRPVPFDAALHKTSSEQPSEPPAVPHSSETIPVEVTPVSHKRKLLELVFPRRFTNLLFGLWWAFQDWRRHPTYGDARVEIPSPVRPPSAEAQPTAQEFPDEPPQLAGSVTLHWTRVPQLLELGASAEVEVRVVNESPREITIEIEAETPYGYGLGFSWAEEPGKLLLKSGKSRSLRGTLLAQRPHEVNLGRAWPFRFVAKEEGKNVGVVETAVHVIDPRPGAVYYVLTEDCETFDGGSLTGAYGDLAVLGNCNNLMDVEEYAVQMIEKPAALNRLAERQGARWTHFWTATQLFAAEWVASRSTTGEWRELIQRARRSIRDGSQRHEYAPHIHFDFEPLSDLPPQPRLLYDSKTDGFLPNEYYDVESNPDHKYHGWDGGRKGISYVRREGNFNDPDSKIGSLRKSTRFLSRLAIGRPLPLSVRTGACDFGSHPEDIGVSTRAAKHNGLLCDSDTGVYERVGEYVRGRQAYFCRADDLDSEINDLRSAGLVQFKLPEVSLDGASLQVLNAWFDRRIQASRSPGVHVLVGYTHAMFMRGEHDPFRSLEGGDFTKLERHLQYVRSRYPEVRFVTASEAVLEYLDYYTPRLRAVATHVTAVLPDDAALRFAVRLLGQDIPLGSERSVEVELDPPSPLDPEATLEMTVTLAGRRVATAVGPFASERMPRIKFPVDSREELLLHVQMKRSWFQELQRELGQELGAPVFRGDGRSQTSLGPALLSLRKPYCLGKRAGDSSKIQVGDRWSWFFPSDLLTFMVEPVAGSNHPIARGFHPHGRISEGAALWASTETLGRGWIPHRLVIEYVSGLELHRDFRLEVGLEHMETSRVEFAHELYEADRLVARIRVELKRDEQGGAGESSPVDHRSLAYPGPRSG